MTLMTLNSQGHRYINSSCIFQCFHSNRFASGLREKHDLDLDLDLNEVTLMKVKVIRGEHLIMETYKSFVHVLLAE